jgi:hypothetical protein
MFRDTNRTFYILFKNIRNSLKNIDLQIMEKTVSSIFNEFLKKLSFNQKKKIEIKKK